jgi:RNA polymerase-interacting CarD/CdnL/TRCF family regulator
MRNLIFTFIILTFSSCKNENDKIISKNSGDSEIYYLNLFKSGEIKDSIASLTFDLASEQSAKNNHKKAKKLYKKANDIDQTIK